MKYLNDGLSAMPGTLNQAARTMMLYMGIPLSAALRESFEDERIGKIMGGIGLTLSGLNLMAKSEIPMKLWNWEKIETPNRNASQIALEVGLVAVGLLTTSCGIYDVAIGTFELMGINLQ